MSPTRLSYAINFGFAPYFKATFMNDLIPLKRSLQLPPKCVSCFDDSLNKVVYSKQMDLHIIYFDEINRQIKRVYIGMPQLMAWSKISRKLTIVWIMWWIWFSFRWMGQTQIGPSIKQLVIWGKVKVLWSRSSGNWKLWVSWSPWCVWYRCGEDWLENRKEAQCCMVHFQEVFCLKIRLSICK